MVYLILALFSFYTQYSYSNDILQLFQSPIIVSLGGDHIVVSDSTYPVDQNPACIPDITQFRVSHYMYHGGFLNVENLYAGGIKHKKYGLSFYFSYAHSIPIEITSLKDTTKGPVSGNIDVIEEKRYTLFYANTHVSYKINKHIRTGLSMAIFTEKLPDYSIKGISIDIGIKGKENERLYWGTAIRNLLGSKIENGATEILRPELRAGIAARFNKINYVFTLIAEYDGEKSYALFSNSSISLFASFGFEYHLGRNLRVRAGTGRRGIALGAGVSIRKLLIDYAIVPLEEIGLTHKLSLTYNIE